MTRFFIVLILVILSSLRLLGQKVVETTPSGNYDQMQRFERERSLEPRGHQRALLTLPFFDDFDVYSLPTEDTTIPIEAQRWEDLEAYINDDYPIDPLTRGVATLDGLDGNGRADAFGEEDFVAGMPSDTLTSLPIDLGAANEEDEIWMMFHYQPGGRGNRPDSGDSLVVEFKEQNGNWMRRWGIVNTSLETDSFYRALIPVDSSVFYHGAFQVRFRNYATITGDFDHWHLDWVSIEENFDTTATSILYNDVAMRHRNWTLLRNYSAMPWSHYITNPGFFMQNSFTAFQRNLYNGDQNIQTGYRIEFGDQVWDFPSQEFNTFGNNRRTIDRTIPLNGFQFDPTVDDVQATFDVKVYVLPTVDIPNDTARFQQKFTNYYAYDDGTAERAISMDSAPGGSLAMRYTSEVPDSVLGMLLHFTPYGNNPQNETFLLRIWNNNGGQPGNEIIENFTFHLPTYYDGLHKFVYYAFDQAVFVDGVFFAGITQPGIERLNIGLDKNSNSIGGNLFFRPTAFDTWQNVSLEGSVLMRPVFRSEMDAVGIQENTLPVASVAPNPVRDVLRINFANNRHDYEIRVYDITGKKLEHSIHLQTNSAECSFGQLHTGVYLVSITDLSDGTRVVHRVIKE
jgi:hypothetical protein